MYHKIILEIDPTVNPVGIEAGMRLQHGTLDHLSRGEIAKEIRLLKKCEAEEPGFLRSCCTSERHKAQFDQASEKQEHGRVRARKNREGANRNAGNAIPGGE